MRALFVIAVTAILIGGFGATLLSFPTAQGIAQGSQVPPAMLRKRAERRICRFRKSTT